MYQPAHTNFKQTIMESNQFETLSETIDSLTKEGYTDTFRAEDESIKAVYSKASFRPDELKIIKSYRFDNMTNPDDEAEVFAIEAQNGIKGTLVMSYSASHSQNVELIRLIQEA